MDEDGKSHWVFEARKVFSFACMHSFELTALVRIAQGVADTSSKKKKKRIENLPLSDKKVE